jgi:hypothetical protein
MESVQTRQRVHYGEPRGAPGSRPEPAPSGTAGDARSKATSPTRTPPAKLIYLAITNAVPAWTRTRNWTTVLLALKIHVGD